MNILLLTNEYPPNVYGGAGVHVEHLHRELSRLITGRHHMQVLHFGDIESAGPNAGVTPISGAGPFFKNLQHPRLLDALYRNLVMIGNAVEADLIHCHTWYTYLAGVLLKQIMDIPLLITIHSLEPHRPWKKDQLGRGYGATCWLEKTALQSADNIIAVSQTMRQDVIRLYQPELHRVKVIYNGIDTARFHPVARPEILKTYGIDPDRPYILFVGRVTPQKGILHLVDALPMLNKGVQAVLCAGAPDTSAIAEEMNQRVRHARRHSANDIIWIEEMVPEQRLVALYSHAAVFVCPSIYEPFGIINLEAMACGTPVVAAAVGGIPEVVRDGETGLLVPFECAGPTQPEPKAPRQYAQDLAAAINALLADPDKRATMGRRALKWVEAHFTWQRIAAQTLAYYEEIESK